METCNLTKDEISRFSRQLILPSFGCKAQELLKSSKALVVGCGGLGCPAAIYLAAAGIGTIGLVDDDEVELNNLHRQLPGHLSRVNSALCVKTFKTRLQSSNAIDMVKDFDVVLDCTDNMPSRYLLNDACAASGPVPLVSGSALRFDGQLTVYLASVAKRLNDTRFNERPPCFRCINPKPIPTEAVGSCSDSGVLGVVPGIIGTMQAAEAIKVLTGVGSSLAGRLLLYAGMSGTTRVIQLRNRCDSCPTCSDASSSRVDKLNPLPDYAVFCGVPNHDHAPTENLSVNASRISVQTLNEWRQCGTPHLLVDIRPAIETAICRLKNCVFIPFEKFDTMEGAERLVEEILSVKRSWPLSVVLLCHRGNNSAQLVARLSSSLDAMIRAKGEEDLPRELVSVRDLIGGLASWSKDLDPQFPVY